MECVFVECRIHPLVQYIIAISKICVQLVDCMSVSIDLAKQAKDYTGRSREFSINLGLTFVSGWSCGLIDSFAVQGVEVV